MKLSILVPIYNVAEYLPLCLDSILNQSYKNFEVILINDGSSDDSKKICEEYAKKDKRFQLINQKNSGYGASLNRAIKKAKGDYVAIVESDDFIHRDMMKILIRMLEKTNADLVKCSFTNFYGRSWKTHEEKLFDGLPKEFIPKDNHKIFYVNPSIWSCVYRKSFLQKNNIKFLETPGASFQDTSFQFKTFAYAKKIAIIEKPLYYYRQDNINSSIFNAKKGEFMRTEFEEINKTFSDEELTNLSNALRFRAYTWNLNRVGFSDALRFTQTIIEDRKTLNFNAKFYLKEKIPRAHEFKFATNHPKIYLILRPFFRIYYRLRRIA
ncbi:MAG: glycosyltransferase [Candidatus Saccharibacteria bacterium]|nr:glycosyltransferase [Candidatus Saccharibacteria bacterium]